jgi:hypothetical protein
MTVPNKKVEKIGQETKITYSDLGDGFVLCPACAGDCVCWACEGEADEENTCDVCDGTHECPECSGEGYIETKENK